MAFGLQFVSELVEKGGVKTVNDVGDKFVISLA